MDRYKELPGPLQIGIPIAIALAVLLAAWMLMFSKPAMDVAFETSNVELLDTAKKTLADAGVKFVPARNNASGKFELKVLEEDAVDADTALAGSGLESRLQLATEIECPTPPGFTATRAANDRFDNCEAARDVQKMLLSIGALAANVSVISADNGTLLGPETSKNVTVQTFLPDSLKQTFDANSVAAAIANSVGTDVDRVYIMDDSGTVMTSTGVMAGNGGATTGSPGECGQLEGFTDVASKQAAVRNCYETSISHKLTRMLGASDRFVLAAEVAIDSKQRTTVRNGSKQGPVLSRDTNTNKSGDSENSISSVSRGQDQTQTTTIDPAGDISKLQLSVTLDENFIGPKQELAVKRLLRTYTDSSRKDPAPKVTRYPFPENTSGPAADITDASGALGGAAQGGSAETDVSRIATTAGTPKALLAAAAVVIIGLLAAIIILWRRSTVAAKDRERMENEFKNEQRLLENFAAQNPDDVARDLESMFGAPSAPEPTIRA